METLIIQTIATVVSMIVIGIITVYIARKSGLSDLQASARAETTLLIDTQRERIVMMERKIDELTDRVDTLEKERAQDKKLIAKLRKAIADKAIGEESGE